MLECGFLVSQYVSEGELNRVIKELHCEFWPVSVCKIYDIYKARCVK